MLDAIRIAWRTLRDLPQPVHEHYFTSALYFGVDYTSVIFDTPGDPITYGVAVMGRS